MSDVILDRRQLLKAALVGAGGVLLPTTLLAATRTPAQTEGPFHPTRQGVDLRLLKTLDKNNDLTFVTKRTKRAQGQVLYVFGTVTDESDKPVADATVEIWQACFSGKYNHQSDSSSYPLDPDFQYWGFAKTDSAGKYVFKTILPGAYRNDPSWVRPPHIHYKVRRASQPEFTTQLYFSGTTFAFNGKSYDAATLARLNAADQVFSALPAADRKRVTSAILTPNATMSLEAGSKYGNFDIVLRK